MTEELKPCKRCGSQAEFVFDEYDEGMGRRAQCTNKDCGEFIYSDRVSAIESWNEKNKETTENIIEKCLRIGWIFKYDPDTRFISANHETGGGSRTICEIKTMSTKDGHEFGVAIAEMMNKYNDR